jgi:outer membrane protein assembly factor BamD
LRKITFISLLLSALAGFSLLVSSCGSSNNSFSDVTAENRIEKRFEEGKKALADQDWTEAIKIFEEIRIQAPTSAFAIEAAYLGAIARYENESYITAASDFRNFRRNYPTSGLAGRAQYMVGESYYKLSPRAELDQTYTTSAISEYQYYLRLYSGEEKPLADSAEMRILELRTKLATKYLSTAELYLKLNSRKPAMMYYERILDQYYDTKPAIEAQLRIAELYTLRFHYKEAQDAMSKFDIKYLDQATPNQRDRAKKIKQEISMN